MEGLSRSGVQPAVERKEFSILVSTHHLQAGFSEAETQFIFLAVPYLGLFVWRRD